MLNFHHGTDNKTTAEETHFVVTVSSSLLVPHPLFRWIKKRHEVTVGEGARNRVDTVEMSRSDVKDLLLYIRPKVTALGGGKFDIHGYAQSDRKVQQQRIDAVNLNKVKEIRINPDHSRDVNGRLPVYVITVM